MRPTIYKTIQATMESELIEKKSRFICILSPLADPHHVEAILANVRQQYPAARHYCYAYLIRYEGRVIEKYSDDGEPNSTAGIPMLNVLKQQELMNTIAVAVRYFGGTLLGTGGLVRAYSGSVIQTLEQAQTIIMEYSWRLRITMDYNSYGNFQSKCLAMLNQVIDISFTDRVIADVWIAVDQTDIFLSRLDDITARTAVVEYLQQDFVPQK